VPVDVLADWGIGPLVVGGLVLGGTLIYCFVRFFLPMFLGGK